MTRSAILVTGSRNWTDVATITDRLSRFAPGTVLIHGDCGGADKIASCCGASLGFEVIAMPAPWDRYASEGRRNKAGPDRNGAMLRMLKLLRWTNAYECVVEAFPMPDSRGTRGMIRLAEEAEFAVRVTEGMVVKCY